MQNYLWVILCFWVVSVGQSQVYTVSGYVKDASTGETLIGANVYDKNNTQIGASTNDYGFYSMRLEKGGHTLTASYLGYEDQEVILDLSSDQRINFNLSSGVRIEEVVVEAKKKDANISRTEMGVVELPMNEIKSLPVLMGETDILKVVQLLPGVSSAGEGSTGLYVRGGGPDQNLVLLDEAVVYNTGHMLGFFSVFNGDAVKNITLHKGGGPAKYGGRLSSVLDVRMKDGNNQSFHVKGGIGVISSKLNIEGPIVKNKASFVLSGRRTYVLDIVQPFLKGDNFKGTNYYFYDFNAKVNYTLSDRDRLYLSGYFGRDVFSYKSSKQAFSVNFPYGNATSTIRWNHLFNNRFFMNLSGIFNNYRFDFEGAAQENASFTLSSEVLDYTLKSDFEFYWNNTNTIKFGLQSMYHRLSPRTLSFNQGGQKVSSPFAPKYAVESAVYLQDDWTVTRDFEVHAGLRYSMFNHIGPYTSNLTGRTYKDWEIVKTYGGWEPRLSMKYTLNANTSLKSAISYGNQYIHLVSNSTSTLPIDVWVPSSELVPPQKGIQLSLGVFEDFLNHEYTTSIEGYYKSMGGQIDYAEYYVPNFEHELEEEFVFGKGQAYGIELFVKKQSGNWTGWLGYTLSRAERTFPEIEEGRSFRTVYDRLQDMSVVASYKLNDQWNFSGVFVYGSGKRYTPLKSLYRLDRELNVRYGPRNSAQLEAYHRLDIAATFKPKHRSKKWKDAWVFSIYNVYNRKNPLFIYYDLSTGDANGEFQAKAYKVTIFPIIPSVAWNFEF